MAQRQASIHLRAGTVEYTDSGDGPAIVFIHGVFVNGLLWRKVVARLEGRYRCIVPTLPLGAHNIPLADAAALTPLGLARLIADFLQALDLREVTLVGNDTGGALCQLVIAYHPERVAQIVLTNCDSFENFPPPVLRPAYAAARIPGVFWALAQVFRSAGAQRAFFRTVAFTVPEPAVLEAMFRPLRERAEVRRDIARFLTAVSERDLLAAAPKLAAFEGRVLIAWGAQDLFFPTRDAQRLAAAFRTATLVEFAGSRTFVPEDEPVALAESIEHFIAATAAV